MKLDLKRLLQYFRTKPPIKEDAPLFKQVDPKVVGLTDAVRSGMYQSESKEVMEGFKIMPEHTVLDVGCGNGLATHFCARNGAHVIFTHIDPQKVAYVKDFVSDAGARKIESYVSDSNPLPLPDGCVDRIMAMEMLEYTETPKKILSEMVRVGKPGPSI